MRDHERDYLISLRYLKKALKIITANCESLPHPGETKIALCGAEEHGNALYKIYIEAVTGEDIGIRLPKDRLSLRHCYIEKVFALMAVVVLTAVIFPVTLVARYKGIYALIILEYIECTFTLIHLKRNEIQKVYYVAPFEKDANFGAFLYMLHGIKVHKICSETRLSDHHNELITHNFSCTSAYQLDEIRNYVKTPGNYYVNKVFKWPPISTFTKELRYADESERYDFDIGIIVSGGWRRDMLRMVEGSEGRNSIEKEFLYMMHKYALENHISELFICLHPIEKVNPEVYEMAQDHYQRIFQGINLTFSTPDVPTMQVFDRFNIGITLRSNTIIERLYLGYKSLIAPIKLDGYPLERSSLHNISCKSYHELSAMLTRSLPLTKAEFYKVAGVEEFHHKSFDYQRDYLPGFIR